MKVHLIACGGAVMHNLALALHENGHSVSGSDDEIYEPAKSRLAAKGLLPETFGWDASRIHPGLDAVILGMHARADNPELLQAQALGLKLYSFPEFVYEHAKAKKRVVIAGSHGKTTTTSMVMHVLRHNGYDFDYLVGAQLEGFDTMVRLSDAPIMVIEGDEYLASPIDRRPKFLHYQADIAIITGVAWDHMNVFPTFPDYLRQFELLIQSLSAASSLIWCKTDPDLAVLAAHFAGQQFAYEALPYTQTETQCVAISPAGQQYPLAVFGDHNMQNLQAARLACLQLGLNDEQFFIAIGSFKGAAKRLQHLSHRAGQNLDIFLDFAHAPSKVKATVAAIKAQFPTRRILACLELHTFSSLNQAFLPQYKGSLNPADSCAVFYDAHTLHMKQMPALDKTYVAAQFEHPALQVFDEATGFHAWLDEALQAENAVLLLMSSGKLGGWDLSALTAG